MNKPVKHPVSRLKILRRILDSFGMAAQWKSDLSVNTAQWAAGYLSQAEGLIELLEVEDCGSVGGFDQGAGGLNNLFDRFELLCSKYKHNPGHFKDRSFPYKEIKKRFKGGVNGK